MADLQQHWDAAYTSKTQDSLSWHRPHLDISIDLIRRAAPPPTAAIIDIGGGQSTLINDLLDLKYSDLSVLDISQVAIDFTKSQLGDQAKDVTWWVDDATTAPLPDATYDVWHDRAVFHFLSEPAQRAAYVAQVRRTLKPGGHVIMATFGPEGPIKCSGLDVTRYNTDTMLSTFGDGFELVDSLTEVHHTPTGVAQQFLYCSCRKGTP